MYPVCTPPRANNGMQRTAVRRRWLRSPAEVDAVYALALRLGVVAPWPPTDMPWRGTSSLQS